MDNFWANALHKDVFPVPGGPCKRIMLQAYKNVQKSVNCIFFTQLCLSIKTLSVGLSNNKMSKLANKKIAVGNTVVHAVKTQSPVTKYKKLDQL